MPTLFRAAVSMAVVVCVTHLADAADTSLPAFDSAIQQSDAAIKQASVEYQLAFDRLQSLRRLASEGNASQVEVEKAVAKLATAKATLTSYRNFKSFVAELMSDSDAIESLRSGKDDGTPRLIVPVPVMANAIGGLQLGTMAVPVTDPLVQISLQINKLKQQSRGERTRGVAEAGLQQELLARLQNGASHNPVEIANVAARVKQADAAVKQVAIAQQAAARHQELLAELQQSSGDRYRLNADVAAALQMESLRQQNIATADAFKAEQEFRTRHFNKLNAIVASGAVPRGEMQFAEYQLKYLAAMRDRSDLNAERMAAEQQMFTNARKLPVAESRDETFPVVAFNSKLPQPVAHLTSEYLADALATAAERLIPPHRVAQAQAKVDAFREYSSKLELDASDSFFVGELHRSKMLLTVAEGSLDELRHEVKVRQLDYLYVKALNEAAVGEGQEKAVMTALENVFLHRADVAGLQKAAKARISYRRWKAQQTLTLQELGVASWLETARSQRDLQTSEAELQKLAEDAEIHQLELQRFQMIRQQGDVITADKRPKSLASAAE